MKKYLIAFLLLLNINTYSQTADSTKVWEAREKWHSSITDWTSGPHLMPKWDLDGNVIPIVGITLLLYTMRRKNVYLLLKLVRN